jgi:hypothetical protein
VVALFWLLFAARLVLIALGLLFIFFYAFIGAAGAGELIPESDYADDFAAEDYPTPGSCPTDFENLYTLQYSLLALYFICMLTNLALPSLNILSLIDILLYMFISVYIR